MGEKPVFGRRVQLVEGQVHAGLAVGGDHPVKSAGHFACTEDGGQFRLLYGAGGPLAAGIDSQAEVVWLAVHPGPYSLSCTR